jgi:hypothetical protein
MDNDNHSHFRFEKKTKNLMKKFQDRKDMKKGNGHCKSPIFIYVYYAQGIKGIVSRDFVACFWCHSIDLKFLLKFHFRVEFFDFRVWA